MTLIVRINDKLARVMSHRSVKHDALWRIALASYDPFYLRSGGSWP